MNNLTFKGNKIEITILDGKKHLKMYCTKDKNIYFHGVIYG